MCVWGNELYFGASTLLTGVGLWKIDGQPPLASDFDRNGMIDFADFLKLSTNFGKQGADVVFEDGDANGDELIDFADFPLLSTHFGETGSKPCNSA